MGNETAKFINSRRRHKNDVAVARQVRIAKSYHMEHFNRVVDEPHRLAKHHATNCRVPGCYMCGNPRHTGGKDPLTIQEKRANQNIDRELDNNGE